MYSSILAVFSILNIELSPILSITVGQIVKTKVRVNLKDNKIIIIFYFVHQYYFAVKNKYVKKNIIHCP